MDPLEVDIVRRAQQYTRQFGLRLESKLGSGKDGSVWATDRATAVKVFARMDPYQRELAVYRRLRERVVRAVLGHQVPQLLRFDDFALVIEMTIVRPPFVLDFAGGSLDERPDFGFSDEVIEEWLQRKQEEFGERWRDVAMVLAAFEEYGIYLTDIHPGNIMFAEAGA
jgi:hypothetical protein